MLRTVQWLASFGIPSRCNAWPKITGEGAPPDLDVSLEHRLKFAMRDRERARATPVFRSGP
jgi:hypothetical protein